MIEYCNYYLKYFVENFLFRVILGLMAGEKLKRAIKIALAEKDWTQKELAAHAHVSPANLSQWLGGHTVPEMASLQRVAQALGKPLSEFIDMAMPIAPLEDKPVPLAEVLPIFHFSYEPETGTRPMQGWIGAAAGNSREVERAEEPIYVYEKLPPDHRYFKIHGDSMIHTLSDGEIVVVKDLGEKGMILPALKPSQKKTPVDEVKRHVPNKSIAVLSIDYGGLTVKRIKYAAETKEHWHLMLIADNQFADDMFPYPVPREKEVIFWALVVGKAKKR